VHVWPTTVMLNAAGDTMAHIAGMTKNFAQEFAASLELLEAKIDREAFEARLHDHRVVQDNPQQAAARHLQVATRMLEKGTLDEAAKEIAAGRKLQPDNAQLQLAQIRVLLLQGKADDAEKVLSEIAPGALPPTQMSLARGKVLAAKGELDQAIEALQQAITLNPNPAEAHFELGKVYQQKGDFEKAATEFRAAYESR